jgi:hypothetical protein
LRVLFREGGLVVLRVASVTLYDAGDADIFSLCERGGMFETHAKGESEFWRVALFRCLEKVSVSKKLFWCVLPAVFALLLLFFLFGSCSLFALLQTGLLRVFEKNAFNTCLHIISHLIIIIIIIIITEREISNAREKSSLELFRERECRGAPLNNNNSFFIFF